MVNAVRVDDEMSTFLTRVSETADTNSSRNAAATTRDLKTTATKTKAPTARSVKNKTPTAAPNTLAPTVAPTVCATQLSPSLTTPSPPHAPTCVTVSTTVLDDFESMSLTGWTDGILTQSPYFTTFLGRNGGVLYPEKLYTGITVMASILKLEFDFYEIDSWDSELFAVVINCVTIPLGIFEYNTNEVSRSIK